MAGKHKSGEVPPGVKVTLDGKPVCLAPEDIQSLAALRECMERIALKQNRMLLELTIQCQSVGLSPEELSPTVFSHSVGRSQCIRRLGEHSVRALRARLDSLGSRIEQLSLLATINDWPTVERLWWDVLPDLRGSVIGLSLLEEAYARQLALVQVDGTTLAGCLEQLATILQDVSGCLARESTIELSDSLERRLMPWLKQMDMLLMQLK